MSDAIRKQAEKVKAARRAEDDAWRASQAYEPRESGFTEASAAFEKAIRHRQDAEFRLANLVLLELFGTTNS